MRKFDIHNVGLPHLFLKSRSISCLSAILRIVRLSTDSSNRRFVERSRRDS